MQVVQKVTPDGHKIILIDNVIEGIIHEEIFFVFKHSWKTNSLSACNDDFNPEIEEVVRIAYELGAQYLSVRIGRRDFCTWIGAESDLEY